MHKKRERAARGVYPKKNYALLILVDELVRPFLGSAEGVFLGQSKRPPLPGEQGRSARVLK